MPHTHITSCRHPIPTRRHANVDSEIASQNALRIPIPMLNHILKIKNPYKIHVKTSRKETASNVGPKRNQTAVGFVLDNATAPLGSLSALYSASCAAMCPKTSSIGHAFCNRFCLLNGVTIFRKDSVDIHVYIGSQYTC